MFDRPFKRALLLAALLSLPVAFAAPAQAAIPPDRSFTVTAAAAAAAWDGPEAVGSYNPAPFVAPGYDIETCSKEPGSYCDLTLVNIRSGGPVTLTVSIGDFSNPAADFDLWVYKSNANGTATEEDEITNAESGPEGTPSTGLPGGFEETTTIEGVEPGYYLVSVSYYQTFDGASYHADLSVEGATPAPGGDEPPPSSGGGGSNPPPSGQPAPPPSGQPAPAPGPAAQPSALPFKAASSLGSAKKAKKKRSLAFKATADQDISNIVVQLLSGKAGSKQKVVGTYKAAAFAKGTRTIKLKLSKKTAKKLKKGKYTLAARGTVGGQAQQVTQAVTIKK